MEGTSEKRRGIKANTGFDMESAHPRCETWTRTCNIDTVKVPPRDMALQSPCLLVLNSNGWADFLSNPILPFHHKQNEWG